MKKLNREKVFQANRNLSKIMQEIQNQVYDVGAETYNMSAQFEGVYNRMQEIQKAIQGLKKELYDASEPKSKQ